MTTITFYGDYTCGDSYRLKVWLDRASEKERLEVEWRPFSLKEARRSLSDPDQPSLFEDPGLDSFSIFALALSVAARDADFQRYHDAMYDAIHRQHVELGRSDMLDIAAAAGVDIPSFERQKKDHLKAVISSHHQAAERWGAFGTPTVVLDGRRSFYIETVEPPEDPSEALEAWRSLVSTAAYPYLREIRRTG